MLFPDMTLTLAQSIEFVGGLSKPSKMPCQGFSIPARFCKTGQKLRSVVGSVCSKCYALKGRYPTSVVQNALDRRFAKLNDPQWVDAMTLAIGGTESSGFFRWHDSGDIQSVEHLDKIVQVARNLPQIRFWLPTREYAMVSQWLKENGSFPENLTVRLSALMLEGQPPVGIAKRLGLTTSGVSKSSFTCPASKQGNKCLTCRACWNKSVENVNYKTH
jgi:Gene product 88